MLDEREAPLLLREVKPLELREPILPPREVAYPERLRVPLVPTPDERLLAPRGAMPSLVEPEGL